MKIYSDDPLVKYKDTSVSPERTKAQIDGILAEYQVKDIHWHWDMEGNDIYVQFKLDEVIDGLPVSVVVKVECPIIWDRERPRGRPPTPEQINWRVSMRAMHWFIKTHLECAYAMQSSRTVAFLPYVQGRRGLLKDLIIPRLSEYAALEQKESPEHPKQVKIDVIEEEIHE